MIKDSFNSLHEIDDECEIVSSDLILFLNEINKIMIKFKHIAN